MLFNGPDNGPPELPLRVENLDPHLIRVPWAHPSLPSNRHVDGFSRCRSTHKRDQQTQRPRYTLSVAIGRIVLCTECMPRGLIVRRLSLA